MPNFSMNAVAANVLGQKLGPGRLPGLPYGHQQNYNHQGYGQPNHRPYNSGYQAKPDYGHYQQSHYPVYNQYGQHGYGDRTLLDSLSKYRWQSYLDPKQVILGHHADPTFPFGFQTATQRNFDIEAFRALDHANRVTGGHLPPFFH